MLVLMTKHQLEMLVMPINSDWYLESFHNFLFSFDMFSPIERSHLGGVFFPLLLMISTQIIPQFHPLPLNHTQHGFDTFLDNQIYAAFLPFWTVVLEYHVNLSTQPWSHCNHVSFGSYWVILRHESLYCQFIWWLQMLCSFK